MINIFMLVDIAHIMLLAKYIATAVSKIGFRPQMSDNLTHTGAAAPLARMNAPATQL